MRNRYDRGRFELKYVLPAAQRSDVLKWALADLRPDPHATALPGGRRGYQVHSLYFDTCRLTDYFERLDGKRVRTRARIRTYGLQNPSQPVFVEVKRKSGPWVVKHRVAVGDVGRWRRCDDPRPWTVLANETRGRGQYAAAAFLQLVEEAGRLPVTLVHYDREVFVPQGDDPRRFRLTLDDHLGARRASNAHDLFAPAEVDLIPSDWMVVELKFEHYAPAWMTRLRRNLGITAVPVSKFGLSVARAIRGAYSNELHSLLPPPILQRSLAA